MTDNSRPSNEQYFNLFQRDPVGVAVLEELSARFYDGFAFSQDPYQTAYNAGRRDAVAYILRRCRVIAPQEMNDE
jgi:hypothetical protein